MKRQYLPFVDWMKALGIILIVVGHVAARPINGLTPPIYPKQLGVAFFIFVLGYSLARERRPAPQVFFNRAFEVYLFGVPIALLLSVLTYLERGTLALSNYLPFFVGANVVFDNFPANPTTWYIGTYLHVLLVWAIVFRGRQVRPWVLAVTVPIEVLVRLYLAERAGAYIAYMLATNWASVFVLGTLYGQRSAGSEGKGSLALPAVALAVVVVTWPLVLDPLVTDRSFPFMTLATAVEGAGRILVPALVTILYVGFSWLVFLASRRLGTPSWVRFLARNTLIVFIGHMPVFYWLDAAMQGADWWLRSAVNVLVCLPGLALLSEAAWRLTRPRQLRDMVAGKLFRRSEAVTASV